MPCPGGVTVCNSIALSHPARTTTASIVFPRPFTALALQDRLLGPEHVVSPLPAPCPFLLLPLLPFSSWPRSAPPPRASVRLTRHRSPAQEWKRAYRDSPAAVAFDTARRNKAPPSAAASWTLELKVATRAAAAAELVEAADAANAAAAAVEEAAAGLKLAAAAMAEGGAPDAAVLRVAAASAATAGGRLGCALRQLVVVASAGAAGGGDVADEGGPELLSWLLGSGPHNMDYSPT